VVPVWFYGALNGGAARSAVSKRDYGASGWVACCSRCCSPLMANRTAALVPDRQRAALGCTAHGCRQCSTGQAPANLLQEDSRQMHRWRTSTPLGAQPGQREVFGAFPQRALIPRFGRAGRSGRLEFAWDLDWIGALEAAFASPGLLRRPYGDWIRMTGETNRRGAPLRACADLPVAWCWLCERGNDQPECAPTAWDSTDSRGLRR